MPSMWFLASEFWLSTWANWLGSMLAVISVATSAAVWSRRSKLLAAVRDPDFRTVLEGASVWLMLTSLVGGVGLLLYHLAPAETEPIPLYMGLPMATLLASGYVSMAILVTRGRSSGPWAKLDRTVNWVGCVLASLALYFYAIIAALPPGAHR